MLQYRNLMHFLHIVKIEQHSFSVQENSLAIHLYIPKETDKNKTNKKIIISVKLSFEFYQNDMKRNNLS